MFCASGPLTKQGCPLQCAVDIILLLCPLWLQREAGANLSENHRTTEDHSSVVGKSVLFCWLMLPWKAMGAKTLVTGLPLPGQGPTIVPRIHRLFFSARDGLVLGQVWFL